ncbi:DNA primase family protein [Shouchella lehensis]|uniref:p4-specific DNA primase n=1 Tax=Shouchella lehensis G1 TaxID=1246626 RepID=A0A060M219_9BACI|nr:phage/plasmid primase, P4 family [Shouchella lehensis]AIC96502.1 P4-specific DNA primase [Shouchella lehensis G1]
MGLKKVKRPIISMENINEEAFNNGSSSEKSKKYYSGSFDSEFLSRHSIGSIRLLTSSTTIKNLLSNHLDSQKIDLLLAGVNQVAKEESEAFFQALLKVSSNLTKIEIMKLYRESEPIVTNLPDTLIKELSEVYEVGTAEERGFLYDEKHLNYTFNANVFAEHFLKRCYVQSEESGLLFLYSNTGVYKSLNEIELGRVIREIMHEGRSYSWKSHYETEAYKALLRAAPSVKEMNVHRKYINVKNGMFNLDTYELSPHSPDLLSTVQIPIEYDPKKDCSKFDQFLKDITSDDQELVRVHQELFGYWLTGETRAEKAVYYYGSGANGKSVMAGILTELVGEKNVSSVPLSEFGQQFGMASIIGKTLNISAENEMGGKALRTENFKAIVSGDPITINIKYRPAISYKPHCRLLFLVNSLPDSLDVTEGYFRKLMIIPFRRTFRGSEKDVTLSKHLKEELPGILNWAILGLKRLRANQYQFSNSQLIQDLHEGYYSEQNPVADFFDDHVTVNLRERTKQADFYKHYIQWLDLQGIDDKGTRSRQLFWRNFKIVLEARNIPYTRKKVQGTMYYEGLQLKPFDNQNYFLNNGNLPF